MGRSDRTGSKPSTAVSSPALLGALSPAGAPAKYLAAVTLLRPLKSTGLPRFTAWYSTKMLVAVTGRGNVVAN